MASLFKAYKAEHDIDAQRVVTAYVSAFGNEDSDGDVIRKGAFADTIRARGPEGSRRIKALYQHDFYQILGPVRHLEEDSTGLLAVFKISETALGNDVYTLYKDEAINEHSIGLDIERRSEDDARVIEVARLWDVSPVTWGANPLTPVVDVKSLLSLGHHHPVIRHLRVMKRLVDEGVSEANIDGLRLSTAIVVNALAPILKGEALPPVDTPALPPADVPDGDAPDAETLFVIELADALASRPPASSDEAFIDALFAQMA